MEEKNYLKKIYFLLFFICIILTAYLCHILSSVILPVIFALFISFALLPVIKFLKEKAKIPWAVSTIILVIVVGAILLSISTLLVTSFSTIVTEYPKYESKFMAIYKAIAPTFNLEVDEAQSFIGNIWKYLKVREYSQKAVFALSSGVLSFGSTLVTVFLLATFLLLEIRAISEKADIAFEGETRSKVKNITQKIVAEVMRFTSIKFIVSFVTAVLVYVVTKLFGMDFPIVWAFIAFVMNFIPIFGSIISCISTTLFAMLQFFPDSIGKVIAIFILMLLINFTIGNILEPRIEGKHLGLSAFIILISLSIWGYIWGFVGMIFAVPIMVTIKIICENIDYLKPIAVFLGNGKSVKK